MQLSNLKQNVIKHKKFTFSVLVSVMILVGPGCAGKKSETPAEVRQQAFDHLRAEATETISDQARSEEAIRIIGELESAFNELGDHLSERSARVSALNADYDSTREEIEAEFNEIQSDVAANQQRVSELHRQLVKATTAEEWVQFSKSRDAVMNAAIQSIQSGSGG